MLSGIDRSVLFVVVFRCKRSMVMQMFLVFFRSIFEQIRNTAAFAFLYAPEFFQPFIVIGF